MKDTKQELHEKMDRTDEQKASDGEKLQQPKKKNRKPIWIGAAFLLVILVLILSFLKEPKSDTAKDRQEDIPFEILTKEGSKPADMHNDHAIFVAESVEQYEEYANLFQVEVQPVDFSKNSVVFAQYVSDGCGLVVEALHMDNQQLAIQLELPLELRNKNDIFCTTIAKSNTVVLLTEKIAATSGVFVGRIGEYVATFNEYEIYEEIEPLIVGYVVRLTDTEMLVTENKSSINLQHEENPEVNVKNAMMFPRHGEAELGDYVFVYGEANDGVGTIDEIQIEKEISVHGANSVVQTFIEQALLETEVQAMETPFIAAAYFDPENKTWEIQVVDGANPEQKRVYTYEE